MQPTRLPAGAMFNLGARIYLLLSNQLHYRAIQFSGSEWILSTPFDASLLTPEPPHGGSFFLCAGSPADPAHPAPWATGATRAAAATAGLGPAWRAHRRVATAQ